MRYKLTSVEVLFLTTGFLNLILRVFRFYVKILSLIANVIRLFCLLVELLQYLPFTGPIEREISWKEQAF